MKGLEDNDTNFLGCRTKGGIISCFNEIAHGFIIVIVFDRRAGADFLVINKTPVVCQKYSSLSLNWAGMINSLRHCPHEIRPLLRLQMLHFAQCSRGQAHKNIIIHGF